MAQTGKGRSPGSPLQPLHKFRGNCATLSSRGAILAEPLFASRLQPPETVRRCESCRSGSGLPCWWRVPSIAAWHRIAGELPQPPPSSTTSFPGPPPPRSATSTYSCKSWSPHIQLRGSSQLLSESPCKHLGSTTPKAA
jgi:hypothetical protein